MSDGISQFHHLNFSRIFLFVEISVIVCHNSCVFHCTSLEFMDPDLVKFVERIRVTKVFFEKFHGLDSDVENEMRKILKVGLIRTDTVYGELERLNK
jgi:hypothetical protein